MGVKILNRLRRLKLFLTIVFTFILYCLLTPSLNGVQPIKASPGAEEIDSTVDDVIFKEPDVPTLLSVDFHDVANFFRSFFENHEKTLGERLKAYAKYLKNTDKEATGVVLKLGSDYEIDNFNPDDYKVKVPQIYIDKYLENEESQEYPNGLPIVLGFDIRLTLSLYLFRLLQAEKYGEEVPFHWYDWVDISQLNKYILFQNDPYIPEEDKNRYNCNYVSTNLVEEFGVHQKRDVQDTDEPEDEDQASMSEGDYKPGQRPGEIWYDPEGFCRDLDRINELLDSYNQNPNSLINFNVFKWTRKSSIRAKMLQSRLYLYAGAPNPVLLIFLVDKNFINRDDGGGLEASPGAKGVRKEPDWTQLNNIYTYEIPIKGGGLIGQGKKLLELYEDMVEPYLRFLEKESASNEFEANPLVEWERFVEKWPEDSVPKDPEEEEYQIVLDKEDLTLRLSTYQFEYDDKEVVSQYHQRLSGKKESDFEEDWLAKLKFKKELSHLDLLKFSQKKKEAETKKHFHEVPIAPSAGDSKKKSKAGGHYDWRFFNGLIEGEEETRRTLHHLLRLFLKFTYAKNIPVWAAHGSLLLWYWNGLNFPWDYDTDVQMPIKDLQRFCKLYNNTLIVESLNDGVGKYYVDCGSYLTHRTKGYGKNNIDARFVDIDKGIYIDITGLALTNAPLPSKYKNLRREVIEDNGALFLAEHKEEDPEPLTGLNSSVSSTFEKRAIKPPAPITPGRIVKVDKDGLTDQERLEKNLRLKIYNCKNDHFVSYTQISPLRLTLIEGTKGFVPQKYKEVLREEYGMSLFTLQYHAQHFFLRKLRLWIPSIRFKDFFKKAIEAGNTHYRKALLKNMYALDKDIVDILKFLEFDEVVLRDYYLNQKITKQHEKEIELLEQGTSSKDVLLKNIEFKPILKDSFLHMKNDLEESREGLYESVKNTLNEMTGDDEGE